jgi:hypothetical protein
MQSNGSSLQYSAQIYGAHAQGTGSAGAPRVDLGHTDVGVLATGLSELNVADHAQRMPAHVSFAQVSPAPLAHSQHGDHLSGNSSQTPSTLTSDKASPSDSVKSDDAHAAPGNSEHANALLPGYTVDNHNNVRPLHM